MSKTINERMQEIMSLRDEYSKKVELAHSLNDKALNEKRDFTDDEEKDYQKLINEAKELNKRAKREEELLTLDTGVKVSERSFTAIQTDSDTIEKRDAQEKFNEWLRTGDDKAQMEYRAALSGAQVVATDSAGGYTVPHEIFFDEVLKNINQTNIIRQKARIIKYKGAKQITMPVLTKGNTPGAQWVGEVDKSPNSKLEFNQKSLQSFRLSNTVLVSDELINNSALSMANTVIEEMDTDSSDKMEEAYLNGDGDKKPLGIFFTDSKGVTIERDIYLGTSSKLLTHEGFVDDKKMLRSSYKTNAALYVSSEAVAELEKMKDSTGRPLWLQSVVDGVPNRFAGFPIFELDALFNKELKSGEYFGFIADLARTYYIPENMDLELFVYNEMYRPWKCKGYQIDLYTGGMPVRPEGIVRLKAGVKSATPTPPETK